jgi:hypothetical protein
VRDVAHLFEQAPNRIVQNRVLKLPLSSSTRGFSPLYNLALSTRILVQTTDIGSPVCSVMFCTHRSPFFTVRSTKNS